MDLYGSSKEIQKHWKMINSIHLMKTICVKKIIDMLKTHMTAVTKVQN